MSVFVLPIHLKLVKDDPLLYVKEAKTMLNRKKQSFEAQFMAKSNALMTPLRSQEVPKLHPLHFQIFLLPFRSVSIEKYSFENE